MGLAFIALFGLGSILGMALLSVAIALPLRLSAEHLGRLYTGFTAAIGSSTCLLGLFIVYRHGVAPALGLD